MAYYQPQQPYQPPQPYQAPQPYMQQTPFQQQPQTSVGIVMQPQMQVPSVQTQIVVQAQPAVMGQLVTMERDWSSGLCGCCEDCCSCFMSLCFPECYTCYLATELNENCCVGVFTPAALIAMRTKIRTKEHIRGGICYDTCLFACCHCCALAQLGREIKMVKQRQGGYF